MTNMFNKFCGKPPTFYIDNIMLLTSEFTGVSVTRVYRSRKELSEFVRSAVHHKIYSFYANNELINYGNFYINRYYL